MKKGFTLIELIISIGIVSIIFITVGKNLVLQLSNYKYSISNHKEELYIDQAFLFIEGKIKEGDNIKVLKTSNSDEIEITTRDRSDYIKLYKDKIIISYGKSSYATINNILIGVKGFVVTEVENTIYIKIILSDRKEYERCFGIRKETDL
ncbi:hypothetical protein GCM10008905_16930 [Clostridium malenominatum]|uniref:Prepilin-type N-terminal cleavage/methylation domain-containing protein n=1 Tax=Clostridium malenominatum TaxID=1539 RepID=A0ABN1IYM5_9CLOT